MNKAILYEDVAMLKHRRGSMTTSLRSRKARLIRAATRLVIVAIYIVSSRAQEPPPKEYQIKAAFLFNFAKFVEWPAGVSSDYVDSFVIGILGDDPFGVDLENTISGKIIHGKKIVIKRFKNAQALKTCHILFISSSERSNFSSILRSLKSSATLTVGEMEEFAQMGGMINFVFDESRIRFQINPEAAEREGLQISSQLLKLAIIVREGGDN